MIKRVFLAIAIIVLAYNAKAEGFAVNLQGNKQIGMGHVGTALNFDASCLQWNPGALATIDGKYSFSVGATATLIKTDFDGLAGREQTDNPTGTPLYFYGAVKANDKLAFGLGLYTPFGNKVDWGKEWSGKYLIQNIKLKALYIQPTISYQLANWISVGAGLNIVYGDVDLNKALSLAALGQPDGKVNISGNTIEFGYNLGVFLQPNEKFNIGISYRSKIDMELGYSDGDVDFTVADPIAPLFPDGGVAVNLPMPASLNVGVAYKINKKWLVSADVNFVQWNKYKSLDFDFETNTTTTVNTPGGPMVVPVLSDSKSTRDWKNTMIYRIGTQYSASEKLDIRAGFYYDETPAQTDHYTPETPGANKIGVSTGFSYKFTSKLSLDASLLYINGKKTTGTDSTTDFSGKYKNTGWIPGIGVTYNF